MRRGLGLILALLVLAPGCVGMWGPDADETPAADARAAPDAPSSSSAAAVVATGPAPGGVAPLLPARLVFSELWLWPVQDQIARLESEGATSVLWFVGIEGIHPDVRIVGGRPYVTARPGKAEEHPLRTPAIEPQGGVSVRLEDAGRHVLALEGHPASTLAVTLLPDGPERATAFIVEEEGKPRFVPDHVRLGAGGHVTLRNQAREAHAAYRVAFLPLIAEGGTALDFTPVDEGLYTLVAEVADDAGRRGAAQGRFLVDYDRPPKGQDVGPLKGNFLGAPWPDEPHTFRLVAHHPVATLHLWGNATSRTGGDATVRVELTREGAPVAGFLLRPEGGSLALADLPPGEYQGRILVEGGNLVGYDLGGRATFVLPVPERLREA